MDPNKLLKLQPSQRFKKSQLKKIIRKLNNNLNKIDRGISARSINDMNWKVSYVSGFNFNDNKRGFIFNSSPCIYSGDKGGAQLLYYLSAIPGQTISTRGFKTNRNVTAEKERNPTLTSRFKAWIGLSKLGVSLFTYFIIHIFINKLNFRKKSQRCQSTERISSY